MIYDKLENIGRYKGISKWLDEAVAFLENKDLTTLPLGKTVIYGEKVFANVMEAQAKPEEAVQYEIHKKYMDIQIDIEGVECLKIGLENNGTMEEFKEDIDFGTVLSDESASCILGGGRFVICMALEPHKPSIAVSEDLYLKKCVIKVAAEE